MSYDRVPPKPITNKIAGSTKILYHQGHPLAFNKNNRMRELQNNNNESSQLNNLRLTYYQSYDFFFF